jgi:CheY-like chemotaxis protein
MPLTVLVVDDNPVVRQILRLGFEQQNWKVEEACEAYEGLSKFRESAPQLVTLDLVMPLNAGISSTQLATMMLDEDPDVKLLVVSSLAHQPELKAFFEKRRIEVFAKPSADNPSFDALFSRIDELRRQASMKLQDRVA